VGETFVVDKETIYQRFGDWFSWLMVLGLAGMLGLAVGRKPGVYSVSR